MFESITPLILTYNEAPNIGRILRRLTWAKRIVVIDSYSTDETLEILRSFPQVEVYQREFDTAANQVLRARLAGETTARSTLSTFAANQLPAAGA